MNYADTVRFLYSLGNELKVGAKWNLERMRALLQHINHPEKVGRFVHVAGTNGKGSTSAMIAASLHCWGKRAGLYTSPHLMEPTERLQVDGQPISSATFAAVFDAVHSAAERLEGQGEIDSHPSYFETVTAMAFWLFAGKQVSVEACEYSVIEVGLGGRLDATNVIDPEIAVITPISFDHESFLGNTLESIAGEKAGIIKNNRPVVMAPQAKAAAEVVLSRAAQLHAPVTSFETEIAHNQRFTARDCHFELDNQPYRCVLPGRHQLQNALTSVITCQALGVPVSAIQHGLLSTRWPGRLEYVSNSPDFLLDGAHNPAGAAALAAYISEFLVGRPIWLVYGTMRDKAIDEVVERLFPLADKLILTAPNMPRALRPEAILELTDCGNASISVDVPAAISLARSAPADAVVIFTGSLFLVGEVRAALLRKIVG